MSLGSASAVCSGIVPYWALKRKGRSAQFGELVILGPELQHHPCETWPSITKGPPYYRGSCRYGLTAQCPRWAGGSNRTSSCSTGGLVNRWSDRVQCRGAVVHVTLLTRTIVQRGASVRIRRAVTIGANKPTSEERHI